MPPPAGKKFYGATTVSTRGQIVIPTEARKDFGIKTGDKVLVFGDLQAGLWIATPDIIQKTFSSAGEMLWDVESSLKASEEGEEQE